MEPKGELGGELFRNEARSVACCVFREKRRLALPFLIRNGIVTWKLHFGKFDETIHFIEFIDP